MKYLEVQPNVIPIELLLEADPSEAKVNAYLPGSWCFAAKDQSNRILGACVLKETELNTLELLNIAVSPAAQWQGIGSRLLKHVIGAAHSKGAKKIELGTGCFGYQLTFYQRLGFRVGAVVKDHFIEYYDKPIIENGIQHKDMLRLYLDL